MAVQWHVTTILNHKSPITGSYLTIIPQASESIAHEAEGRMGY